MKTCLKIAGFSLALALGASSHALTFNEGQNTHFTEYFNITPTTTDKMIFSLVGLTSQFTALSFDFVNLAGLSQSVSVLANAVNPPSQLSISFSDIRNSFGTGAPANYSLLGGTPYLLRVRGDTRALIAGGGQGTVTLTVLNATVSAVPEPETYAMLLAGLGMLGAGVRRRKASAKAGLALPGAA